MLIEKPEVETEEEEGSSLLDELAESSNEGDNLFDEGETTESPTESPTEEVEEVEEKPEPFHLNPRWKAQRAESKAMREENDALKARLDALEEAPSGFDKINERLDNLNAQPETKTVPLEHRQAFGDNYDAYSTWLDITTTQARKIAEEMYDSRQQAAQAEQQKQDKASADFLSWAEGSLSALGKEEGLDLTDPKSNERNQILKICEDYGIVGKDGNPDFIKANALRKQLFKEEIGASDERKAIADKASTNASSPSVESQVGTMTSKKLKTYGSFADYIKQNK